MSRLGGVFIVILLNYQVSIRHTGEGRYPGDANKCEIDTVSDAFSVSD